VDFLPSGLYGPDQQKGNIVISPAHGRGPIDVVITGITRSDARHLLIVQITTPSRPETVEEFRLALLQHRPHG
jgi:hypothetical protein